MIAVRFLALALVPMLLGGCGQEKAPPKKSGPVPVETAVVEQRDVPIDILAVGTVESIASVELKAKVGGEVTKVNFTDGSYVKAGDSIVEIDPRPYQVVAQRAEANLAMAEAQSTNAAEQLKRCTT